jgi:hypothetical protein
MTVEKDTIEANKRVTAGTDLAEKTALIFIIFNRTIIMPQS